MKHEIKEKIIEKSISLEKYGVNDLAWRREDAKNLIISIMSDEIGILGGNVCKFVSSRLEFLCDNWFSEKKKEESNEQYYLRSKVESLKYIENYPIQLGEEIVFSITFTERIK